MEQLRSILLSSLAFGALLLGACNKDQIAPPDLGYDYVPLEVGAWYEYKVDSVVFDEFNNRVDSFELELRDEIVEVFDDLDGRDAYRIERFKRPVDSTQFVF